MRVSFYFYDLETSGVSSRSARIMQFAGQRTDMQLRPIAEPDNILIKLSDDVLPEPDAILITGITPQKTRTEGISEAEFLKYFHKQIAQPDTIFVGFNNIRFDDEFMRFANYRNFYDAYEWSWRDGRSRWDLLDVVRMTRALRPEGIDWPYDTNGKPSNKLELLTSINKLEHKDAHDALSDVYATIAVARLIRNKQPRLFEYLLKNRSKESVKSIVKSNQPFIYTSGKYPSAYHKTTLAFNLGDHPNGNGSLVYNLRYDPEILATQTPAQLAKAWTERVEDETKRFPIKVLQFNRCPSVAQHEALRPQDYERLSLDKDLVMQNLDKLRKQEDLYAKTLEAIKIMDKQRQTSFVADPLDVDSQLYDSFINDEDKILMSVVRAADSDEIAGIDTKFSDPRLNALLPLYKARNFSQVLTTEERQAWEDFRIRKLLSGGDKSLAAKFFNRLIEISQTRKLSQDQSYLIEELKLYGQSILPDLGD